MVRKLFKHEFLALARLFIPVYAIFIAMSVFGRVLQFFESDSMVYSIISTFSLIVYFVAVFAVILLTMIFCVIRFYKNLFTNEGYLTFTLPTTPTKLILVKLVTATAFEIATVLTVLFSLSILTMGEAYSEIVKAAVYLLKILEGHLGVHLWLYIFEIIVALILATGTGLLLYYSCITVGQMFRKNRILAAVGVYFAYYIINQIISTIITIIVSFGINEQLMEKIAAFVGAHMIGSIHTVLLTVMAFSLALSAVYFFIIRFIIKRKLNLE